MIVLLVMFAVALAALITAVFLLGFRTGSGTWKEELMRVKLEAAEAQRQMHDLTRQAFVKMAEAVEQRPRNRGF